VVEDFATFVRREMPSLVRRELETLFAETQFATVDASLRSRVADLVVGLQPRLMDAYRQQEKQRQQMAPEESVSASDGGEPGFTPSLTGTGSGVGSGTGSVAASGGTPDDRNKALDLSDAGHGDGEAVPKDAFPMPDFTTFDWDGARAGSGEGFGGQQVGENGMPFDWESDFDHLLDHTVFAAESQLYIQPGMVYSATDAQGKRAFGA
jgi:hypothetical protein